VESYSPDEPVTLGLLSIRHGLLDADPEPRPDVPKPGTFVEPEPPLRAFSPAPPLPY
jgi:hypothetical protein